MKLEEQIETGYGMLNSQIKRGSYKIASDLADFLYDSQFELYTKACEREDFEYATFLAERLNSLLLMTNSLDLAKFGMLKET